VLVLSEEFLLFELAGFEGHVGLLHRDDARDAVVRCLPVEGRAVGGLHLQLIRREFGFDAGVEDVVGNDPLVVVASDVQDIVLTTLELVTAPDDDCLQVLPAALVDGGVVLDNRREQLTTADDVGSVRVFAIAIRVTGGADSDEDFLEGFVLALSYLSSHLSLVEAGGQRVERLAVGLREVLLVALTLVLDRERVARDKEVDEKPDEAEAYDSDYYR